jgi:hypothetical protein
MMPSEDNVGHYAMAPVLMKGLRGMPFSYSSCTMELKGEPDGSRPRANTFEMLELRRPRRHRRSKSFLRSASRLICRICSDRRSQVSECNRRRSLCRFEARGRRERHGDWFILGPDRDDGLWRRATADRRTLRDVPGVVAASGFPDGNEDQRVNPGLGRFGSALSTYGSADRDGRGTWTNNA